jgi:hypothetical protein
MAVSARGANAVHRGATKSIDLIREVKNRARLESRIDKPLIVWSGRPGSNRRHSAWETWRKLQTKNIANSRTLFWQLKYDVFEIPTGEGLNDVQTVFTCVIAVSSGLTDGNLVRDIFWAFQAL